MNDKNIVFETEWFNIERLDYDHTLSSPGKPYYRMNSPDGVLVLALTEDNRVILIEQFRPAIKRHTLEIPAGSIDSHESPEEAARRELLEETGYSCQKLTPLGVGRLLASRLNSLQYCFLGQGAAPDPSYSPKEPIKVRLVSLGELKDLMMSGEFQQYAAFAPMVLADWKAGTSFTRS